jgi:uncharacterized protein (DUF433 family)
MNDKIISTPGVVGGKPCIAGRRISVELVLEDLAGGQMTIEDIIKSYDLTKDEVLACLDFAKNLVHLYWKHAIDKDKTPTDF